MREDNADYDDPRACWQRLPGASAAEQLAFYLWLYTESVEGCRCVECSARVALVQDLATEW